MLLIVARLLLRVVGPKSLLSPMTLTRTEHEETLTVRVRAVYGLCSSRTRVLREVPLLRNRRERPPGRQQALFPLRSCPVSALPKLCAGRGAQTAGPIEAESDMAVSHCK